MLLQNTLYSSLAEGEITVIPLMFWPEMDTACRVLLTCLTPWSYKVTKNVRSPQSYLMENRPMWRLD